MRERSRWKTVVTDESSTGFTSAMGFAPQLTPASARYMVVPLSPPPCAHPSVPPLDGCGRIVAPVAELGGEGGFETRRVTRYCVRCCRGGIGILSRVAALSSHRRYRVAVSRRGFCYHHASLLSYIYTAQLPPARVIAPTTSAIGCCSYVSNVSSHPTNHRSARLPRNVAPNSFSSGTQPIPIKYLHLILD